MCCMNQLSENAFVLACKLHKTIPFRSRSVTFVAWNSTARKKADCRSMNFNCGANHNLGMLS